MKKEIKYLIIPVVFFLLILITSTQNVNAVFPYCLQYYTENGNSFWDGWLLRHNWGTLTGNIGTIPHNSQGDSRLLTIPGQGKKISAVYDVKFATEDDFEPGPSGYGKRVGGGGHFASVISRSQLWCPEGTSCNNGNLCYDKWLRVELTSPTEEGFGLSVRNHGATFDQFCQSNSFGHVPGMRLRAGQWIRMKHEGEITGANSARLTLQYISIDGTPLVGNQYTKVWNCNFNNPVPYLHFYQFGNYDRGIQGGAVYGDLQVRNLQFSVENFGEPPQTCSDGTPYNQCSITRPLYCNNGQLVNNCQQCGCPQGQTCQANGSCLPQQNQPPVATITQPTQISFTVNTPINYAGTGSDPEQGNLPGTNLCWSYDITGDQQSFINLGCRSSGTFTPTVIINNQSTQYILKLVATDSQGLSGNATKTLTINPIGGGEGNITNITYQENFESYNIGSIPPRWNIISGTWQITQDSSKVFSRLSSTSSSTTTLSNFTHDTYLFEGKVKVQNTFGIFMNYINSNNWYRVIYLGGTDFRLEKRYLGSATALTRLTYNPQLNNWYYFKFLIQKNNTQNLLKYKMWKVTDIEPSTWLIEYPDSQNILSGGTIGLYAHDSSSTLSFDDLKVSSNVISPQTCSDGTLYGQCSINQPLFCNNGTLENRCQQCGCTQGVTCQPDGTCQVIQNQPPVATITQPTQISFTVNTPINYAGTGSDPEQGNLPGTNLCWSYDITGDQQSFINLGCRSSGTFTPTVIINNQSTQYILKLVATDSQGLSGNATKTLTINPIIQQTCTDSDGGLVYNVRGTTSNGVTTRTDDCGNRRSITEYYCSENNINSMVKDCRSVGYNKCRGGACVQANFIEGVLELFYSPKYEQNIPQQSSSQISSKTQQPNDWPTIIIYAIVAVVALILVNKFHKKNSRN